MNLPIYCGFNIIGHRYDQLIRYPTPCQVHKEGGRQHSRTDGHVAGFLETDMSDPLVKLRVPGNKTDYYKKRYKTLIAQNNVGKRIHNQSYRRP